MLQTVDHEPASRAFGAVRPLTAAALRERMDEIAVLRDGLNPRTGRPASPLLRGRLDEIHGALMRQIARA